MHRILIVLAALAAAFPTTADAQFATVGGGVLLGDRLHEPVAELHAETPPFLLSRAYLTLSWTDESASPTVITAAERSLIRGRVMLGLGAGLLWLEPNDYKPYPILVSTTIVPLPIPRTAVLAIASTQPFQDFEWSLVLKVGVTFWFVR
jgi:hypothetical protein